MTIDDAKKILMEIRPERPIKSENRRLQKAIDMVLEELDVTRKALETLASDCVNPYTDDTKEDIADYYIQKAREEKERNNEKD